MSLADKKCEPCEGGTKPFSTGEAKMYLEQLHGWTLKDQIIERTFEFQNFKESMKFVNQVADIAEAEGHHPDMYIFYNMVRLELSTHAIGGLSINDFILAAKIDTIPNPANK